MTTIILTPRYETRKRNDQRYEIRDRETGELTRLDAIDSLLLNLDLYDTTARGFDRVLSAYVE